MLIYLLTFEEELHSTIRPIIFKTSALNLNDVKLMLLNYALLLNSSVKEQTWF